MPGSDQHPLEQISFEANAAIGLQGEAPTYLGILRKGRVDILVSPEASEPLSLDQVSREGVLVESLEEPGQLVGEAGALLRRNYATLIARERTTLERIPLSHGSIDKSILKLPSLGMTISRSLAARLTKKNAQLKQRGGVLTEMRRTVDEYSLKFYRLCEHLMRTYGLLRPVGDACRRAVGSETFARGRRLQRQQQQNINSLGTLATARRGRFVSIQAGADLYNEGAEAKELYILARGVLEILAEGRVIEYVRPGEVVGETAFLLEGGGRRTETVRARTFSQVAAIPGDKLDTLVKTRPALILHVAKVLAQRIANADAAIGQYDKLVAYALQQLYGDRDSCAEEYRRLLDGVKVVQEKLSKEYAELSSACEGILKDYDGFSAAAEQASEKAGHGVPSEAEQADKAGYDEALGTLDEAFTALSSGSAAPDPQVAEMLRNLAPSLVHGGKSMPVRMLLSPHSGSLAAHCLNTALVALKIGRELGVTTEELEIVAAAGALHDVGMLGKAEGVSEEEELVLHVSKYAEEKFSLLPDLPGTVRRGIREHHEYWDGSGQPKGLAGEEISLPARLLAVANDLDIALMKEDEPGKALEDLRGQRKRYWPEAYEALLRMVRADG